ncbi:MAG: hypothetical protein AAB311_05915, partial [Nitrospirota bacterium]
VPDAEIDLEPLLERSAIQRGDICDQYVRYFSLRKPGGATGQRGEGSHEEQKFRETHSDIIPKNPSEAECRTRL